MLVSDFDLRRMRLDFTSSGQGQVDVTEFVADGIQLVNAIELLDFTDGMVQLIVCTCCGFTGCEQGSWAIVRRAGDKIAFVPAIESMRKGDWESMEYSPPRYMINCGPIVIDLATYQVLREKNEQFPDPDRVKDLSANELLVVIQLLAPGRVLGPLGMPATLNAENIVAVTAGDLEEEIDAFQSLIGRVQRDGSMKNSQTPSRITEFHLDTPNLPAWRPFGYDSEGSAMLNMNLVDLHS